MADNKEQGSSLKSGGQDEAGAAFPPDASNEGNSAQASLDKLDVFEVSKMPITEQTKKSMTDLSNYAERVGKVASFAFTPPQAKESGGQTRKRKVLIVMSDTGGGHKASANSIAAAVQDLYGEEIEVVIRDILEDYTLWASNRIYNWWSSVPWLWGTIYNSTKRTHGNNFWLLDPARTFEPTVLEGFIRCTQEEQPDCIISVHPILQSAPRATSSHVKAGKNIPFMTVVTDLGEAHPWWFNKGLDRLVVPTATMKDQAVTLGLQEEQLAVCGLPVRQGFWNVEVATAERKRELKENMGLDQDMAVVLLAGGGEGMGKLKAVAQSFFAFTPAEGVPSMQVVIVCGSNAALRTSLSAEAATAKGAAGGMRYRVEGFVNNMDEWMQASTVIVTKAGPGTIAEACCCGLPILLYDFLPGQEEGNVTFVKEGGLGEWLPDAEAVAQRTSEVVGDVGLLEQYTSACRANARPRAALDIAEIAKQLIVERWGEGGDEVEGGGAVKDGSAEGKEAEAGAEGGGGGGEGKEGGKYVLRSSWWSWLSYNNTQQAPSWWREQRAT